MERVADYIIDKIQKEGVNHIFLVTGRGILYLSDAVARNKEIEGISVFHEQSASYAAMAYAQANNKLGACLVSTGCAATNAITGVLCAWQDNIPCVFISGQHMLQETVRYTKLPIRTYGSQEADIVGIVKSITKYAVMLTKAERVVYEVEKALYLAQTGRKGPVWIDIPLDVQNMRIEPDALEHFVPESRNCNDSLNVDMAVKEIVKELNTRKRPVVFIGGGVRSAGADKELEKLVETNGIPLVFSPAAADTYGSGNTLSIGAVGSLGGSRAGNFAVQNADYILAIGTKLCSQSIGADPSKFARDAFLTVVDIDELEHTKKGARINRLVISDAKTFLKKLNSEKINVSCEEWTGRCVGWKDTFRVENEDFIVKPESDEKMDLYFFTSRLSERLADDTTIITDAGFEELIVPSTIKYRYGQRCLFPASQGAMGYAVPAIIGAHYSGRKNIVAIVGDGSVMMNIQELQTIGFQKIPVKIIIINNNMYAVIRKRQKDLFRTRTIGNDFTDGLSNPDFRKIAESFGIKYMKIEMASELSQKFDLLFECEDTVICEIICTEDQKYFHSSYAINKNKKVVRRPIEDMSPFLDREKFESEMVVASIDQ